MTTERSLEMQDHWPFTYASDLRWTPPCRLATRHGVRRLPQFPGTGPCLEELLTGGAADPQVLADTLMAAIAREPTPLTVVTLHAEVEGGPYAEVFERMVPHLAHFGDNLLMRDAVARCAGGLSVRRWTMRRPPGRAFPVTMGR